MPYKSCEDGQMVLGVMVTAKSSDGTSSECTLGSRNDIVHRVELENLSGYEATTVECEGTIREYSGRAIKFRSTNSADTETKWTDDYEDLPDGMTQVFEHVNLLPVTGATGQQDIVSLEVKIEFAETEESQSGRLNIDVKK